VYSIHAGLIAMVVLAAPSPERIDCGTVGARYDAAIAKVVETLRAYEKCVASSDKQNDCSAEMQAHARRAHAELDAWTLRKAELRAQAVA